MPLADKLSGVPNDGAYYDGTFEVLLYTGKHFLFRDFEIETDIEITLNECRILRDLYRQFSKKNHRVYVSKYMQHYKEESIYFSSTFGSQYKLGNFHLASLTEIVLFSRNKFPGLF